MCSKVMIGFQIFSKKIRIFPKDFCLIKMKIKLKSTLYFDFCFVSKLIWCRNSDWNKISTQTFHKITYSAIILARCALKFLDLNFLYFSKVLVFFDYILSLDKVWDKIKSKKERTFSIIRKVLPKNIIILRTKIRVL